MSGILLFLVFAGVALTYGYLKNKSDEQRSPYAAIETKARHAKVVWDSADVETRTLLLRSVIDIQDDRLFLAYVNAPWAQLPNHLCAKLTGAVIIYEDTPSVLNG